MKNVYEREYYLRTADFDPSMNLLPTAILDLFQDVAGCHSIVLGCGLYDLLKIDRAWVLVNTKYTVLKSVKMFEKVVVKTWPLAPRGVRYQREYQIINAQGEVVVIGSQTWTIIDLKNRKILPAGDVYTSLNGEFLQDKNYQEKLMRIPQAVVSVTAEANIKMLPSDLDVNGHVNNVRYAKFVYDNANLQNGEYFKELQIDYHKELKSDQVISLKLDKKDDILHAVGTSDEAVHFGFFAKIERQ